MDSNQFGASALIFLETYFPGGVVAFTQQGGLVSSSSNEDTILIYHPEMPEKFTQRLNAFNDENDIKFLILDKINFSGMQPQTIMTQLYRAAEEIKATYQIQVILFNPMNPLMLYVTIPFSTVSDEVAEDIISIFSKVEGVVRGCVNIGGVMHKFSASNNPAPVQEPDRDTITAKTVADIKATLANDLDVLEFIKML
jgi:hypothetical protein